MHVETVYSFSLLYNNLLCEYAIIIKIYPVVDGHLGGFQFQAVMNNAALNILVRFFFFFLIYAFLWGPHLRIELLGLMMSIYSVLIDIVK